MSSSSYTGEFKGTPFHRWKLPIFGNYFFGRNSDRNRYRKRNRKRNRDSSCDRNRERNQSIDKSRSPE